MAMRAQGDLTMTQIAEELGVSPASLYRRLARHRQETEVHRKCREAVDG
jgi:transposase-like protein